MTFLVFAQKMKTRKRNRNTRPLSWTDVNQLAVGLLWTWIRWELRSQKNQTQTKLFGAGSLIFFSNLWRNLIPCILLEFKSFGFKFWLEKIILLFKITEKVNYFLVIQLLNWKYLNFWSYILCLTIYTSCWIVSYCEISSLVCKSGVTSHPFLINSWAISIKFSFW